MSSTDRTMTRTALLRRYGVLDTPPESAFDDIAKLAAQLCATPLAFVSLIDGDRHFCKARVGADLTELPLDRSICAQVIDSASPIVVIEDTAQDPRTANNPYCTAKDGFGFYAGAMLRTPDGVAIGTLCVLDHAPRTLSHMARDGLVVLARAVMSELDLRLTQRRLAEAVEDSRELFFALGEDLRVIYANAAACAFMGLSASAIYDEPLWGNEGTDMRLARQLQAIRAERRAETIEAQVGPVGRWLELSVDASGSGIAIHARDVTQRHEERERLKLLETAIAQVADVVLITEAGPIDDPHPRIIYANPAFEKVTGFSPAAYLGQSPRILQGPLTQRGALDQIRAALESWSSIRTELVNYTKAGEPFWLELDITPVRDSSGWYTHWVAIQRDITERKRQQTRFEAIADVAADVIYDLDPIRGTIFFSDGLRTRFGHEWVGEQTVPTPWIDCIHETDARRVRREFAAALLSDVTDWQAEYRLRRGNGDWADVVDRCRIIRDETGTAIRAIGSVADVTLQRRLEQELRQSQRLETVGKLTGGLAHDFNNLLTVILGNAELLEDDDIDASEQRRMAAVIRQTAERGAALTQRLLAFARRQPLAPKSVEILGVLENMGALLDRTLGPKIAVEILVETSPLCAMVDVAQLESALLNLCLNARDAMPDGGTLTLRASGERIDDTTLSRQGDMAPGEYAVVEVRDTGVGMTGEVCARAFEPFYTTKGTGKGSGLGLSMVYGFAKQSGGDVRIDSAPGEGASVRLFLPRSAQPTAAPTPRAGEDRPGDGEAILMVEDDPLIRAQGAEMLTRLGYRVATSPNAAEALAMLETGARIDLLFTDILMPGGMDGTELAEKARALRPTLPLLLTSGFADPTVIERGRRLGTDVLLKPYRRASLVKAVRAALHGGAPHG